MVDRTFFFAGGGTGGHIYPGVAVADKIVELQPTARIRFLCSSRPIDSQILGRAGYEYTALPAEGFSVRPGKLLAFCRAFYESCKIAAQLISQSRDATVIGVGGFVSGPVCWAAHRLGAPLKLLNVDVLPGRANKLAARWADEVFVQFDETADSFAGAKTRVNVVGCPLRGAFGNPQPQKAIEKLGLSGEKKILLVTGASSGSASINTTICMLLERFSTFAADWQIVHLTGQHQLKKVRRAYSSAKIENMVVDYFDDMGDLLAATDLAVGRSGAVSVAEYAAAAVPSICMPYPHHRDMHQYLNAGKLVESGAAIIVDDLPDDEERAEWLWEELQELMTDEAKRLEMKRCCQAIARKDAAGRIARELLQKPAKTGEYDA